MGEAPAFFVGDLDLNDCDLNYEGSRTITHIGDDKYTIGATDDTLGSSIQVKVYDKFTGNWLSPTVLGTKPKLFMGHSAFPLNNDRILVVKQNSSLDDCLWFLEVGTRYVRNREAVLGTEVVCWSKGVLGDSEKPIVISGPSGVGKGTLISKLMKEFPSMFGFSVSHTTRAPREKEKDGVHYHFTERSVMEQEIKDGKFLEFASVHGNLYGTSMEAVEVVADSGKRCILDIDVQGARSVRDSSLPAIFIFICPPSIHELERRLRSRGTETNEQIEKRIQNASVELKEARSPGLFDHILENDDLEKCYNDLKRVLGLEVALGAASHKTLMVVSAVLQDSRLLLTCSGNEELQKASKNISVVNVSSVKGGAPGRTRGLKLCC